MSAELNIQIVQNYAIYEIQAWSSDNDFNIQKHHRASNTISRDFLIRCRSNKTLPQYRYEQFIVMMESEKIIFD